MYSNEVKWPPDLNHNSYTETWLLATLLLNVQKRIFRGPAHSGRTRPSTRCRPASPDTPTATSDGGSRRGAHAVGVNGSIDATTRRCYSLGLTWLEWCRPRRETPYDAAVRQLLELVNTVSLHTNAQMANGDRQIGNKNASTRFLIGQ